MQQHPALFALQNNFEIKDLQRICLNPSYTQRIIPKKSGCKRKLWEPDKDVKQIQRALLPYLNNLYDSKHSINFDEYQLKKYSTKLNFRKISVKQHAGLHSGNKYIFKTDIKDFYPSISRHGIEEALQNKMFNVPKLMAEMISYIGTYQGKLIQGAPTSPVLANLYFASADRQLMYYALNKGLIYSRYVDDIVFSSTEWIHLEKTKTDISKIIGSLGFKINKKKTMAVSPHRRQIITNIVVNEKPNVDRKYIRKIRAILHHIKFHNIPYAAYIHFNLTTEKLNPSLKPLFISRLNGMISWVGQVRGKNDTIYLKLLDKFNIENEAFKRLNHHR